jgi:quinol monooxygenase YgiN
MTNNIVTVTAIIKVKPGLEEQAREVLLQALAPTRAEPGCLNYDLHQSVSDPTEFLFHENWASEEALRAHSASEGEHRLALRRQLGGLVDGPPRITSWRRIESAS